METMYDNLIEKVQSELLNAAKNHSTEEFESFVTWMKYEYVNYMLMTRDLATNTLKRLKEKYCEYTDLVQVLENNINEYASLKVFFIVSKKISNP